MYLEMKRFSTVSLLIGLLFCITIAPVGAETIQIQIAGLDFTYDGSSISDAASLAIGNAVASEADELANIEFFVDGVSVGSSNTGPDFKLYADLLIEGVVGLPKDGGTVITGGNGNSLGFELFSRTEGDSPVVSELFSANIDQFAVNYTVFGDPISVEFTALAGPVSELLGQALPLGVAFDPEEEISISLSSANLTNVADDGTYVTGFDAFGTGEIVGASIPEPGMLALLVCGAATLLVLRRRRQA